MDQSFIINKIDEAIKSLNEVKELVKKQTSTPETPNVELETFENLKKVLLSDKWPNAVNPALICNPDSDVDKQERGSGVIELLIEDTFDKMEKFLDFGCGEGHCAVAAAKILDCKSVVGYDSQNFNWPSLEHVKFTNSFEEVSQLGPYNAILLFDVLDHINNNEGAVEVLKKAASVLVPQGNIYIRVHPWISRHGTHLYHKLNKAFAHLVFTEEELKQLTDYNPEPNIKVIYPLKTYSDFFKDAGLKIVYDRKTTQEVEAFFKAPKISERIIKNTGMNAFPEFQMSLGFIDYVLTKA